MSGIPSTMLPKTSNENSKPAGNRPDAYWIVIDNKQNKQKPAAYQQHQDDKSYQQKNNFKQRTNSFQDKVSEWHQSSQQKVIKILQNISKEYATNRFINCLGQQITKQSIQQIIQSIEKQFSKFKLTKRNLVFTILIPSVSSQIYNYICTMPYYSKLIQFYDQNSSPSYSNSKIQSSQNSCIKLKISRRASIIVGSDLFIDLQKSSDQIQQQLIKQMKLDFIWVGVLNRLGTDVCKFQETMIEEQDFYPKFIGFYERFLYELDRLIFQHLKQSKEIEQQKQRIMNPGLLQNFLQSSKKKASQLNPQISTSIEQLIRSNFNSRVIISDIVSTGDYLPLLFSRNYFNLLYIESNTITRFNRFKQECQTNYNSIAKFLNIETFLIIDDYWYRTFVLKCLPHVKFIIHRGNQDVQYSVVITKNYKQIIPSYRPNFDEYFLSICNVLKQRSGCLKEAVGSIIVKQKRIISTGYNGTPIDCVNCFNGGCKVCNNSEKMNTEVLSCTCIHAEYGCILQAGIKVTPGSTLYSTKFPCLWCCKLIIQGRISKIVCLKSKYPHLEYENIALARQILAKANIQLLELQQTKVNIYI